MKDKDYIRLSEWVADNGCLVPVNDRAQELVASHGGDEVITMFPVTPRDGRFHRTYFKFIAQAWEYIPKDRKPCKKKSYYNYLKLLKNNYDIERVNVHGYDIAMIEYDSISYGSMDEVEFQHFVKMQIPLLYDAFYGYFDGYENRDELVKGIIETLEEDFRNLMYKIR